MLISNKSKNSYFLQIPYIVHLRGHPPTRYEAMTDDQPQQSTYSKYSSKDSGYTWLRFFFGCQSRFRALFRLLSKLTFFSSEHIIDQNLLSSPVLNITLSCFFPFLFKLYVCFKSDSTYKYLSHDDNASKCPYKIQLFSNKINDFGKSSRMKNKKNGQKFRENSKMLWEFRNSETYVLVNVAPFDVGDFRIYAEAKFIYQFTCFLLAHMRFAFNFKNKLKSDKITDLLIRKNNLECFESEIFMTKFELSFPKTEFFFSFPFEAMFASSKWCFQVIVVNYYRSMEFQSWQRPVSVRPQSWRTVRCGEGETVRCPT